MKFNDEEFRELYFNLFINIHKTETARRQFWVESWTEEERQRCLKRRDFLLSLKDKFDQELKGGK